MFSRKRALLFVIAIAVGPSCAGGGCSPSDEEEADAVDCNTCPPEFTTSGTVSFQNDLFDDDTGIIRRACTLGSTCHGANPGGKAGLYLGPSLGPRSACGADTGAAACAYGSKDCGTDTDDTCHDAPKACTCGGQHCPSVQQRCIADPTTGGSMCGLPSDAAGVCATDADCNGGAVGTCVDPEPTCSCGGDECTSPGQRCVPSPVDTDTALKAAVINGLNRASKTFPSMMLVTPGDPTKSFLMWKVDGCQTCGEKLGVTHNCATGETGACCSVQSGALGKSLCGDRMPRGSDKPLSKTERDKIRLWIAQGAQNN